MIFYFMWVLYCDMHSRLLRSVIEAFENYRFVLRYHEQKSLLNNQKDITWRLSNLSHLIYKFNRKNINHDVNVYEKK